MTAAAGCRVLPRVHRPHALARAGGGKTHKHERPGHQQQVEGQSKRSQCGGQASGLAVRGVADGVRLAPFQRKPIR